LEEFHQFRKIETVDTDKLLQFGQWRTQRLFGLSQARPGNRLPVFDNRPAFSVASARQRFVVRKDLNSLPPWLGVTTRDGGIFGALLPTSG
jgi:hypothetical protein